MNPLAEGSAITAIWTQDEEEKVDVPTFEKIADDNYQGWLSPGGLAQFQSDDNKTWEFSLDIDEAGAESRHWIMDPQMDIKP